MTPFGFSARKRLRRLVERHDLRIDAGLAHAPRDELRHLAAEIDDEDGGVGGRGGLGHAVLLRKCRARPQRRSHCRASAVSTSPRECCLREAPCTSATLFGRMRRGKGGEMALPRPMPLQEQLGSGVGIRARRVPAGARRSLRARRRDPDRHRVRLLHPGGHPGRLFLRPLAGDRDRGRLRARRLVLLPAADPGRSHDPGDWRSRSCRFWPSCAVAILIIHFIRLTLDELDRERAKSAALAEQREVLFRELQHRISNNLAIVSALLNLERAEVADEKARQALTRGGDPPRADRQDPSPAARPGRRAAPLRAVRGGSLPRRAGGRRRRQHRLPASRRRCGDPLRQARSRRADRDRAHLQRARARLRRAARTARSAST